MKELLQKVRDLLACGWHRGCMFRDSRGEHCTRADAVSHCTLGAIINCGLTDEEQVRLQYYLVDDLENPSITSWNDGPCMTKNRVLAYFDGLIERTP